MMMFPCFRRAGLSPGAIAKRRDRDDIVGGGFAMAATAFPRFGRMA